LYNPASPWSAPPVTGVPAAGSTLIFDADFDAGYGGDGTLNTDQTLASYYTTIGTGVYGSCEANTNVAAGSNITNRGCRLRVRLVYTPPVVETGLTQASTPSKAGQLAIYVTSTGAALPATPTAKMGDSSGTNAQTVGVTVLSCGLLQPTASSQIGTTFALNMRYKIKKSAVKDPSSLYYESWAPTGEDYSRGFFRETKMKFTFPNISVRGAYQWRMQAIRSCKTIGATVTNKELCCSGAVNASNQCIDCIRSGQASASANSCCSEELSGANCK
jgi:hypothetical protein